MQKFKENRYHLVLEKCEKKDIWGQQKKREETGNNLPNNNRFQYRNKKKEIVPIFESIPMWIPTIIHKPIYFETERKRKKDELRNK